VTIATVAVGAAVAQATPPQHFADPIDLTYQDDFLTDFCGFPVNFTLAGVLKTTLFYDNAGNIVHEVDTQPGTTETFSSPASGKSFSWRFSGALHTDYTDGAALGSAAIASGTGLSIKAPGVSAAAGRVVFDAIVVDYTPSGIPITAFNGVISATGSDPQGIDEAICAALAP
jgi:hypothetical protein